MRTITTFRTFVESVPTRGEIWIGYNFGNGMWEVNAGDVKLCEVSSEEQARGFAEYLELGAWPKDDPPEYLADPRTVRAYFCSWSYPPLPDPAVATVSIQYHGAKPLDFEDLVVFEFTNVAESKRRMVAAILHHHCKQAVSDEIVERLLNLIGHSWTRMEPKDITLHLEKCGQQDLFAGIDI